MPLTEFSTDSIYAVLRRAIINHLRYPRICVARQCRRHKRCNDMAIRNPRCAASLHPLDMKPLTNLMQIAVDIVEGRYPACPADDFVVRFQEYAAINILLACFDDLPCFTSSLWDWFERYSDPSVSSAGAPEQLWKFHAELTSCTVLDDIPAT